MKQEKKHYESPQLTVVSFHTERGYALSGAILKTELDNMIFEYSSADPYVTEYETDNGWADYSWN